MAGVWIALCVLTAAAALNFGLRLLFLRKSIREIAAGVEEKLNTDTNTVLTVSTGDQTARRLAAQLNTALQALRKERLRLQNGDAALKTAVTNISHDLRTPLTAICGYLDLLEQETHTDVSKRYLAVIRERTDAMRTQTEELLRYAVAASTAESMHFAPVNLNDVLEQCLAGFYGVMTKRGMTPQIQIPAEKVIRTLDVTALRRIFENILNNAVKYTDGDLTVVLQPDGSVSFANHAANLSRVQMAHLFDRFFTVESASRSTGIGLSIAKSLTEKMNGTIHAAYQSGILRVCVHFPA